jgi:3-oxoacyl-[acyl-carrier-protein] synthase-3
LLEATGTSPGQLDWLLLHQANQRILDAVAQRFSKPQEQVLSNLAHYGNTSAATIPLMLDEAVKDGRVQAGHLLASSGFGAGLSWGGALLRWSGP